MVPVTIRTFDSARDRDAVYALWETTLGKLWPTTASAFHSILDTDCGLEIDGYFVATRGERLLGFVATKFRQQVEIGSAEDRRGSIPLIMVAPEAQRQGIGTALMTVAVEHLQQCGVCHVQAGAGSGSYFWPGVPENLPGAMALFQAQGWENVEISHDLLLDLRDYVTPPGIMMRAEIAGVRIHTATGAEVPAILRFQDRELPQWTEYFMKEAGLDVTAEAAMHYIEKDTLNQHVTVPETLPTILAAWDAEGNVVGTLLMFTAQTGQSQAQLWMPLLGNDMGGLGAVGVAEAWREKGVGTALVARASEILKERGVRNSHIGWTWLLDFYGRLGYAPWRSYAMFHKEIIKG